MSIAVARLRKYPRPRAGEGHPWVYAGEITGWKGEPNCDDAVHVEDARGRFIGAGLFSPESSIRVRIFSRKKELWNKEALESRVQAAIARRGELRDEDARRLVWSEADGLPGLVVDRYGKGAVVFQILHAAMERCREDIVEILERVLEPEVLAERSDSAGRRMEGLEVRTELVAGTEPTVECRIGEATFVVDLLRGQKSGAFLDQAENYRRVAEYCRGKTVLDCFSHQGGFGIHAAATGATRVLGVDISGEACEAMKAAAELNGQNVEVQEGNVFDDLRAREKVKEKWDIVVLDPPSFTRSRSKVADAMRGYREINLRALRLLSSGGHLATFTCSHHISAERYLDMLRSAAWDAGRDVIVCEEFFQGADHPVLLGMPESRYLHGWLLRVV